MRNFSPSKLLLPFFRTFLSEFASQNAAGGKKRVSLIKLYTNTQSFLLNKLRAIVTFGSIVPNAYNRCLWMPLAPSNTSALYRGFLKILQNPIFHSILIKYFKMGCFQFRFTMYISTFQLQNVISTKLSIEIYVGQFPLSM